MSQQGFDFYNVEFKGKGALMGWLSIEGQITNNSVKSYQMAVFRAAVFDKISLVWTGVIKVPGFRKGQTRDFSIVMEGVKQEAVAGLTKHEICFESGY